MSYKMAVGSSDGKVIDQHFGRSERFYIYDVSDEGDFALLEVRDNKTTRAEGQHQVNELNRTIEMLSDCSKVLVLQIGMGAQQALKSKGITAYASTGSVDDALTKLIAYESKRKNRTFLSRDSGNEEQ